ncbi:UNVERIFIED_CONTAM: hypothetical protein FKN15_057619 [Acipenser sinensis]
MSCSGWCLPSSSLTLLGVVSPLLLSHPARGGVSPPLSPCSGWCLPSSSLTLLGVVSPLLLSYPARGGVSPPLLPCSGWCLPSSPLPARGGVSPPLLPCSGWCLPSSSLTLLGVVSPLLSYPAQSGVSPPQGRSQCVAAACFDASQLSSPASTRGGPGNTGQESQSRVRGERQEDRSKRSCLAIHIDTELQSMQFTDKENLSMRVTHQEHVAFPSSHLKCYPCEFWDVDFFVPWTTVPQCTAETFLWKQAK